MSGNAIIGDGIYKEKKKTMAQKKWTEFNIHPGMTTWVDMPQQYKNQYFRWEDNVKKKKEKKRKEQESMKKLLKATNLTPIQVQAAKEQLKNEGVGIPAHLSNMMDERFFKKMNDGIVHKGGKRKILLICDVRGWAWWNKSQYLKHYLHDDFNIDIINVIGPGKTHPPIGGYDLWFTYGYSYIQSLGKIPKKKGRSEERPFQVLN